MQEFFEKVKDSVAETAKTAVKKSNELVEITKTKFAISEKEGELKNIFHSIGEYIYEQYKGGSSFEEDITSKCVLADEANEKLEVLSLNLATLKKEKICEKCKKNNPDNACFCTGCGEKF